MAPGCLRPGAWRLRFPLLVFMERTNERSGRPRSAEIKRSRGPCVIRLQGVGGHRGVYPSCVGMNPCGPASHGTAPWGPPTPVRTSGANGPHPGKRPLVGRAERVSTVAPSWSLSCATPKRLCVTLPAPTDEVNIQSGMAGFTLSDRTPPTAICVGEVGGVEGEGGDAFSPFSLHGQNMPPKLGCARDPLSPSPYDEWKLLNDSSRSRVADPVHANSLKDRGYTKGRPRNRAA